MPETEHTKHQPAILGDATGRWEYGVMVYKDKRMRVVDVEDRDHEGRQGWFAHDAWSFENGWKTFGLFYPAEMFTFEPGVTS